MRYAMPIGIIALLIAACQGPGYGVKDTDQKTEAGQPATPPPPEAPPGVPDKTPGFSIWSMFGSNKEFVRKRLDPGIGKAKTELAATMGETVQCTPNPKGGEVCLWHDKGMAEGGTSDPSMHQVYYSFAARRIMAYGVTHPLWRHPSFPSVPAESNWELARGAPSASCVPLPSGD